VSSLSGVPALALLGRVFSAELAVRGFFVVSGYLVVMSCLRSASIGAYAAKRVRRIYPGYAAVILLSALGGSMLSSLPPAEYFSGGFWRYLGANLVFLNFLAPELPGVFAGNPLTIVNGALWTLKIEVMFYALVPPLLWGCRRVGALPVVATLYAMSVGYDLLLGMRYESSGREVWLQLQRQLPGQLTYFLVGAVVYLHRDRVRRHWPKLLAAAVAAFLLARVGGLPLLRALLEPVWLGIGVVFVAVGAPFLGNFARFGDLSYGVYILHFPVLQALVASGLFATAPWGGFCASLLAVVALALLSWHCVEKPFLAARSHYRLAEKGSP
jgi:peptidoglycan/LPS O-acetylase OafA/YrhL